MVRNATVTPLYEKRMNTLKAVFVQKNNGNVHIYRKGRFLENSNVKKNSETVSSDTRTDS